MKMKFYSALAAHRRAKNIASHLNEKLALELGTRSITLRKGDTVKIVRGSYKGKEGKVIEIDRKAARVYVEKIIRKKSDGAEVKVSINASNLIVTDIERTDRKRFKRGAKKGKK
jgi:large subunit ribosomal protein L24